MSAVKLHFKKLGEGNPIFILHGLFGSLDNWQTIANELMNHYSVYLIDLRNHGKSPHTDEMNYQLMAEDIVQLMIDTNLDRINLIGHSMGGKICFQLLKNYSEYLNKVMVIDIVPKEYKSGHDGVFKAMFSLDLERLTKRSDAEAILQEYITEPGVRQFILKNLYRISDHQFKWKLNLPVLFKAYDHIRAGIVFEMKNNTPIRIVSGGNSNYVNGDDINQLSKLFQDLSWKVIEGAGHWVHADKPKEVISEVNKFFIPNSMK
ncbi:MAG: alpha/beta fold hydrolase [Saprospiraceae bacterium]|nr:alpha/beta fold hydrolase [Saprospiraceae bacterium]